MRLDQMLVHKKLCESRQEAQECIARGAVLVDGVIVLKQTKQVEESNHIEVLIRRKFVSRGGEKLEGALNHIYGDDAGIRQNIQNKRILDVGSSTGGFTDCVLQYGALDVTAVDVGTSQLHPSLRTRTNVFLFENTDIRTFTTDMTFDIIVADVSFVSLEKILDTILSFGSPHTEYFLLIKPQFEVGFGNTKKGIVKDDVLVETILKKYKELLIEKTFSKVEIFPCSITGGDGNQEYFIYTKR